MPGPLPPINAAQHQELAGRSWVTAFWVRIPFPIRSKSNFRRYTPGDSSKDWREHRAFEQMVAMLVQSARPPGWDLSDHRVKVADRPPVVAFVAASSRLDAANFSKSVIDACEGVLFVSDASVLATSSVAVRGTGDAFALGFAQLGRGAGPVELHTALAELGENILARFDFA